MIVVFKLTSSETIISNVIYEDETFYLIKNPLKVNIMIDRKRGIKMMTEERWCSLADDNIMLLSKNGVMAFSIAAKEHVEIYNGAVNFYEKDDHVEEEGEDFDDNSFSEDLNPLKETLH